MGGAPASSNSDGFVECGRDRSAFLSQPWLVWAAAEPCGHAPADPFGSSKLERKHTFWKSQSTRFDRHIHPTAENHYGHLSREH